MLDVSGSMEGNLPLLRDASDAAVRAAPARRPRPRRHVRRRHHHQPGVHPRSRRAAPGAARRDRSPTRRRRCGGRSTRRSTRSSDEGDERRVILVLSDGKDSGPIRLPPAHRQPGRGHRPRAADDVMVYAIGMRSRRARRDAAGHRARRPAGRADRRPARPRPGARGGGDRRRLHSRSARARISAPPSRRSPTNCTASICSGSRRRSATARCTTSTSASRSAG